MFEQLINGLTQGSVYALLALGFTVIFGTLRMVTFAHGEVFMVGAYIGLSLFTYFSPNFFFALVIVLLATFILGAVMEIVAFRFLRDAPHFSSLLVTIGISILLINVAQLIWGPGTRAVPPAIIEDLAYSEIEFNGIYVTYLQLAVLGVAIALMVAMYLFMERTKIGMAIRATAQDHEAAFAMGVNVNRVFTFTFAIGSMMGGVAGLLVGLYYNVFFPTMGTLLGLKAFSASVVGGLSSLPGAVVAGLIIGVVESFAVEVWDAGVRHMVSFLFMIVVLIARPAGLFGKKELIKARGD
ncbi:MAG: branched-chain amino acid ABC transporter permease [Alphaproteobacteria bacterium]|nr:branched-chain amino acid ABC transporter permease [Alphaproteobacteria bacterium]MDP7190917.1 branched-chain amino acid ABC transporter permease [Alphaproteobacteria bacterium]